MEKDKLEIVLEDVCDDLKALNNIVSEQRHQSGQLQQRFNLFEDRLKQLTNNPRADAEINALQAAVEAASNELKQLIAHQPQPIMRQWRFLLFPEHYSKEYYAAIFRLIMWMTLVCSGAFLFSLGKQALENSKEVKLIRLENDQYKNAWQYMYHRENKQGKKKDGWYLARAES